MKVRVDVYLGEDKRIDLEFLEKRSAWLPGTGIYLEFILKGVYHEKINFMVQGDKDEVLVSRYSWNRFFLNLRQSGTVNFVVLEGDEVVVDREMFFQVEEIDVPIVYSVTNLLSHPVSDIRYFANRLSENLVNTTRFTLFTPSFLERVTVKGVLTREFLKFYEMIFSILTERGISLIVSPYGDIIYALDFIKDAGKEILWQFVDLGKKYNVVWDFTSGLRAKELGGLVDSVWGHFKEDARYAVFSDMVDKVGGEGFSYLIKKFHYKETPPENEKGVKIARLAQSSSNFYNLRVFAERAVVNNWGVELCVDAPFRQLRRIKYSLGKALVQGYKDARGSTNTNS
jgi:hypothetical protein